uniref:Uncharacterized protein n=1 Tax=Aotus nancymaae TaxID=37293 RepID=A0A2K5C1H4_AOTNA
MYDYFGENGPKCEKDVKKKTLFSPMKYTVYFKRRKVKRYLKIAGAKQKPTRAQHLSTFPTSRQTTLPCMYLCNNPACSSHVPQNLKCK